jgi:DNA polymerase (family 10)
MRGDLHCHTSSADGQHSIEEMARTAQKLGYQYLAVTDHSKRLAMANGLDEEKLLQQIKKIDQLNKKFKNFRVLKSIECDILADGTLDLADNVLKELDFVIGAIHSKFNLPSVKQTERILRAMDNPYFNILAHPTGRLINKRDAYEIDLEKIMRAAKQRGCILEVNSQPDRLDLNDVHCKLAKEMGLKLAISTDAHNAMSLSYMRGGIDQARRGWLEAKDVVNTRPLRELQKLLHRK